MTNIIHSKHQFKNELQINASYTFKEALVNNVKVKDFSVPILGYANNNKYNPIIDWDNMPKNINSIIPIKFYN